MPITGRTRLVGIIGYPVGHSLSPKMQNAAFEALELDYYYLPLEVRPERLGRAVKALCWLGFRGFNVTIPHKRKILRYLDALSPEARFIGAVNTVEVRGGRLIGHNTDGGGFTRAFKEEMGRNLRGRRVLILGAGGAARAVAFQSAREGAEAVVIANRSPLKARALVRDLKAGFPSCTASRVRWNKKGLKSAIEEAEIVINATPVGMRPEGSSRIPDLRLTPRHWVFDLVYGPIETDLIRKAREAGAHATSGMGMLIHQGALSFQIWTGHPPPIEVMREAMESEIKGNRGVR